MDAKTIAAEFERRARDAGLTIPEMCRRAEIAPITLRRWKNGKASPNHSTTQKLERVLSAIETSEEDGADDAAAHHARP